MSKLKAVPAKKEKEVVAEPEFKFVKKLPHAALLYGSKQPITNEKGEFIGEKFMLSHPFPHSIQHLAQQRTDNVAAVGKYANILKSLNAAKASVEKVFNDLVLELKPKDLEDAKTWKPEDHPEIKKFLTDEVEIGFHRILVSSDIKVGIGVNKFVALNADEVCELEGLLDMSK